MLAWPEPGCPEELWRLERREIEQFFEGVIDLKVAWKTMQLSSPSADAAFTLTLDFRRGFELSYREDYHGP